MGLSASQARLLSITQRINNNELQSEMISNAKIQLSARNTAASDKYINALDTTKLEYISYNDTGIQEKIAFTFNALNQYTPLKNQYALFNNENQIYVSSTDAANFAQSKDLFDFLSCYGLFDRSIEEDAAANAAYEADHADWVLEKADWLAKKADFDAHNTPEWATYNSDKAAWESAQHSAYLASPEYLEYLNELYDYNEITAAGNPYDIFKGIVGTSDAPLSCYSSALNNPLGNCYRHVLGYLLLDFSSGTATQKNYTTSHGKTMEVKPSHVSGSTLQSDGKGIQIANSMGDVLDKTYSSTGEPMFFCDGDDDLGTEGQQNLLQEIKDAGGTPTAFDILRSDYIDNGDGSYSLKSLQQKAVDMMYIITNQSEFSGSIDANKMRNLLKNFTDGDLHVNIEEPMPPAEPTAQYPVAPPIFNEYLRPEPQPGQYTQKIYDKPLAQWYINLWNIMDGNTVSDELDTIYDEQANFDYYTVPNAKKTSTSSIENDTKGTGYSNFVIMNDNLASDKDWLQFAINNGQVTLSQAAIRNNTNGSNITWERVESTSTSDIYETQDDTKIAKAEAEYKKTMAEIQAEDKQLDIKIKKLDTEHSALLKEVESIKGVMDKNTERSYSAFS